MDAAFEWLDRATRESHLALILTLFRPFYSLHDDPRWAEYRERMGQSEEMLDAVSFEFDIPR